MNTRIMRRLFALLLSLTLIFGCAVIGTTAYVADATPPVTNTFVYDPSDFPADPTPTPAPAPTPIPEIHLPDTGDHSCVILWSVMLMLSACGFMILRRRRAA